MSKVIMKSNVIVAAIVGLIIGIVAEFILAAIDRIPIIGCLFTPVALLAGLALPILIGWLAAMLGDSRGWLTTPSHLLDGALAAALAEFIVRILGFCASIVGAGSFYGGPRVLSVEPGVRAMFTGVWSLGWLVVALAIAAILGAIGAFVYDTAQRRK
jgi:hypothetical protein